MRRALVFAWLATATLAASLALASDPAPRPMKARWSDEGAVLSISFRELADDAVRRKLTSGLPQTITTRILAYSKRGNEPLSAAVLSCHVVYDLWEGRFRVRMQDTLHDRNFTERRVEDVIERCFHLPQLTVAATPAMRGKRVYFAALTELNPMSRQTVRNIRRWLSRPGDGLEGDAFFGSFVSIFVDRELGGAERSVSFRSGFIEIP